MGHFVAEIAFPRAGDWKWAIEPQPYAETSFSTLTVLERPVDRVWPASSWGRYLLTPGRHLGRDAAAPVKTSAMTVEILDPYQFAPYTVEVAAGTAVTWVNHSEPSHTVTGDALAFDDSGPIGPGQTFSTRFDQPGTYQYRCAPHPGMVGVIVVM